MGLFSMLKRVLFRGVIDFIVIAAIFILIPGLPPHVKFESYTVTPMMNLSKEPTLFEENAFNLDGAEPLLLGKVIGPESVAIKNDIIYTGIIGGEVIKLDKDNSGYKVVAKFGQDCEGQWEEKKCGRPLGMKFDKNGKLIVADAYYGLFSVDVETGKYETLVSSSDPIEGKPPLNPNFLDLAADGTIYWSDSSTNFNLENALYEFSGEASGRLLKYNPVTKKSEVLISDIHFANGVYLSKNEDFVLVCETARSRVLKYHLKGSKKGESEVFLDGLPGSPDNITPNGKGGAYLSLIVPRSSKIPMATELLGNMPWVRKFLARLLCLIDGSFSMIDQFLPNVFCKQGAYWIGHLQPLAEILPKKAMIIELNEDGKFIKSYQSIENKKVSHISEFYVDEKGAFAYLGSPYNNALWRVKLGNSPIVEF